MFHKDICITLLDAQLIFSIITTLLLWCDVMQCNKHVHFTGWNTSFSFTVKYQFFFQWEIPVFHSHLCNKFKYFYFNRLLKVLSGWVYTIPMKVYNDKMKANIVWRSKTLKDNQVNETVNYWEDHRRDAYYTQPITVQGGGL
jgi:hypothetical protein